MNYINLIAILAVSQLLFFSVLVALARGKYGVKAPAVTGHESFERTYRVQMNTLEQIVVFLPALFIAGQYWPETAVAGAGLLYLIGRFVYWRAYVAAPGGRTFGFALSALAIVGLLVAALIGVVTSEAA